MNFTALHQQKEPLVLCNIWDVPSTKIAEKLEFKAIGTSSSAIASVLGYQDGEEISFTELELFVKRISSNTTLPLSVDLESGYSRKTDEIVDYIRRLASLGVVGINIEDSLVGTERKLVESEHFANQLSKVIESLTKENLDIFINVRIDTFLLSHPDTRTETKRRIRIYEDAGANGIFIPGIVSERDIADIIEFTQLPLNVMSLPGLPDFERLAHLGVKRISMGNFLFEKMYTHLNKDLETILENQSFNSVFK